MKRTFWIGALVLAGMVARAATNDLTTTLQKGLFEEEANRNLDAAIQAYQSVANQFDKDRRLAATAIFRLGECYRKQGNTNGAAAQFERVVREFSDQSALVTLSRQNLAAFGVGATAATNSPTLAGVRQQQKWLLEEEVKLMEKQLEMQKSELPFGRYTQDDLARTQRDLLKLKQELAKLEAGQPVELVELSTLKTKDAELTNSEAEEVKRIQALIKDSPDLINAADAQTGNTPLHRAAAAGQLVVAQFLLANGANTEAKGQFERTPLHNAAAAGHKAMVELLLSKKANVQATERDGLTPLHLAAESGYRAVAESLLAHGAPVDAKNKNNSTPLLLAAAHGFKSVIELLLDHGADINAATDYIYRAQGSHFYGTALCLAAQRDDLALAEFLLSKGAAVDAVNKQGRTALSYAAQNQNEALVQRLLAAHANPNAGNSDLPLACAAWNGNVNILQLLVAAKADVNASATVSLSRPGYSPVTQNPASPLFLAVQQKHPAVVKELIKAKADLSRPDPNGQSTVIFWALTDSPTLEALLESGADPNQRNQDGLTPLQAVLQYNYANPSEVVKVLLAHGAEPNVTAAGGWTPLHNAAQRDDTNSMALLLQKGANVNAKNVDGGTPLRIAVERNQMEAAKLLLEHKADPNLRDKAGLTALDYVKSRQAMAARPGFAMPLRTTQIPGSATLPGTPTEAAATPLSMADLLRQNGALDDLPRLDAIELRRPSTHYSEAVFTRGTNTANQFTLAEAVGVEYALLEGSVARDAERSSYRGLVLNGFRNVLSYPDLAHVHLRKPAPELKSWQERTVDLTPLLESGVCSNDVVLSWGEVVEIPEQDHPLNFNWRGFTTKQLENLLKCLSRQVEIVVKGQTTKVALGPKGRLGQGVWPEEVSRGTLWLHPTLLDSGLVLASSDLARVKLIRRDKATGQKREWVVDCTSKGPASDFWLQDGDVIEVPEKGQGYGMAEPQGKR